jgi:hypothetical protein
LLLTAALLFGLSELLEQAKNRRQATPDQSCLHIPAS